MAFWRELYYHIWFQPISNGTKKFFDDSLYLQLLPRIPTTNYLLDFFTFFYWDLAVFSVHFCTFLRLVACNTRNVKHGYNKHDSTQYFSWLSNLLFLKVIITNSYIFCALKGCSGTTLFVIERLRELLTKHCELFCF